MYLEDSLFYSFMQRLYQLDNFTELNTARKKSFRHIRLFPYDIDNKLFNLYNDGLSLRQMYTEGLMIESRLLKYKEIQTWHRINRLKPNTKKKALNESFDVDYKGEESLFCDTEFLESLLKKQIRKSKECK